MKSSADTVDLTRTVTVSPLTGKYIVTSLFHPGAQYLYCGLRKMDQIAPAS